jgi:hypothetical protein
MSIIDYSKKFIPKDFHTLLSFYLIWMFIHHISAHMYIYFCTPNTWYGLIISPFMVSAPHCSAIRWVMYEGGNMINTMWISVGTYMATKILTY